MRPTSFFIHAIYLLPLLAILTVPSSYGISGPKNTHNLKERSFKRVDFNTGMSKTHQAVPVKILRQELIKEKSSYSAADLGDEALQVRMLIRVFNKLHRIVNSELVLKNIDKDKAGNTHIILTQQIGGVPVYGGTVAVHLGNDGEVYDITGDLNLNGAISTAPGIGADNARSAAKKYLADNFSVKIAPKLIIAGGKLAYFMQVQEPGTPGYWNFYIDAQTGDVLSMQTTVCYFTDPPGFPANGAASTINGNRLAREDGLEVSFTGWRDNSTTPNGYYLFNRANNWEVGDYLEDTLYHHSSAGWAEINRFAISASRNIDLTQTFIRDSLGRQSLDNANMMVWVGLQPGLDNGYWTGDGILLGGGAGIGFDELAVLDVIAHEAGHGLTNFNAAFYNSTLNEMYADITGCIVEQTCQADGRGNYIAAPGFRAGEADWLMGEECWLTSSGTAWWIRNPRDPLSNGGGEGSHPSLFKGSSWRADNEPHFNSTVGSHAFYLLAEGCGSMRINDPAYQHKFGPFRGLGLSPARDIAWRSQFSGRLTSFSEYPDVRRQWISSAKELGFDAGVVAQVWAAVGVISRTVGRGTGDITLPSNPPNHTTIQAAINAAARGDLIYVYPGTYTENLTINAPEICLVGRNPDFTVINGRVAVGVNGDGFTMAGFTLSGTSAVDGITVTGTSSNTVVNTAISGNTIHGFRNGIVLTYTRQPGQVMNNIINTCTVASVALSSSSNIRIVDNNISERGISLSAGSSSNNIFDNRLRNIANDAVLLGATCNTDTIANNLFENIALNSVNSPNPVTNLLIRRNVFLSPSGMSLGIASGSSGNVYRNSFVSKSYTITSPSSIIWNDALNVGSYWDNYTGQDMDGDGIGETGLPVNGVDGNPQINRSVSPLRISYLGESLMNTSTTGECLKVVGDVKAGAVSGLKFGSNVSLTTDGNLISSLLINSSQPWLSINTNLAGGLVFRNSAGAPAIYIGNDGVVRIPGSFTPNN